MTKNEMMIDVCEALVRHNEEYLIDHPAVRKCYHCRAEGNLSKNIQHEQFCPVTTAHKLKEMIENETKNTDET